MSIVISNSVVLDSITMNDYSLLYKLMERIYPPSYNYLWPDNGRWYLNYIYGEEHFTNDLEDKSSSFYFVKVDDEIEGILKIQDDVPYPEIPHKKATRLHRIYLSEHIQGIGISGQLLNYVEKRAAENGCDLVWLDCMESKKQALRFYEKHGFQMGSLTFLDYELIKKGYNGIYFLWKSIE